MARAQNAKFLRPHLLLYFHPTQGTIGHHSPFLPPKKEAEKQEVKRNGLFRFDTYIMRNVLGNTRISILGKSVTQSTTTISSLLFCSDASLLTFKLREISVGFPFPLSRGRVTKSGGGGNAGFANCILIFLYFEKKIMKLRNNKKYWQFLFAFLEILVNIPPLLCLESV